MPSIMDVKSKDEAADESNDIQDTLEAFDEIAAASEKLSASVNNLLSKDKDCLVADEGLSILTVKNHLLLQYLTNLVFTILSKCSGKSIQNSPSVERLVEIRTVIERIRPLEQKLKYQIDKLVKIALTGAPSADDGTQFRANPTSLMNDSEESDEDEDARPKGMDPTDDSSRNVGKYVPPRLAAMKYDGEETLASKQKDLLEKAKKRALSSSIVQKMQEEYLDAPVEIAHSSGLKNAISKEERERTEYEETNYTRLPRTKRDKILAKQRAALTSSSFGDELTKFDDFQTLDQELNRLNKKRKKSFKSSGKKKKKMSFKKKKRFHK
nr:PREDICTED: neuroguidin [Bemisia tabaci]